MEDLTSFRIFATASLVVLFMVQRIGWSASDVFLVPTYHIMVTHTLYIAERRTIYTDFGFGFYI